MSIEQALKQAGFIGLPFTWGADGKVEFDQSIPMAQQAAIKSVIVAALPKETKERMWESIKAERDRRQLDGGVKVDRHWFKSDERATSEYNTIVNTTCDIPDNTIVRAAWRTMDGAEVSMTPALALKILTAGIQQRCAHDDAAQAHKVALFSSASPETYDFSGGWPDIFEV